MSLRNPDARLCDADAPQPPHAVEAARLDSLRNQLAAQPEELERIRTLLADADVLGQRLATDKQALTDWATGLEAALEDIRSSLSWRATHPLRLVARLLRGAVREAASMHGWRTRPT